MNKSVSIAKGLGLLILGALALTMPTYTTYALNMILGWLFLIAGIIFGLGILIGDKEEGLFKNLVLAALLVVVAVLMLANPVPAMLTLSVIVVTYLMAQGVVALIVWFRVRKMEGAGWLGVNGLISLVLAGMILAKWPTSGLVFIGIVIAIHLIFWGIAEILYAIAVRKNS